MGRGRLRIELPKPVNGIGYQGGAAFYPLWSVKIRLIAEGDRPLDIVELGVTEDGVGEWAIDEKVREGGAGRVSFPIRPRPSEEFWIRARSPLSFETKPTSFGRMTLWCRDHTQREEERHQYIVDRPPVG